MSWNVSNIKWMLRARFPGRLISKDANRSKMSRRRDMILLLVRAEDPIFPQVFESGKDVTARADDETSMSDRDRLIEMLRKWFVPRRVCLGKWKMRKNRYIGDHALIYEYSELCATWKDIEMWIGRHTRTRGGRREGGTSLAKAHSSSVCTPFPSSNPFVLERERERTKATRTCIYNNIPSLLYH